MSGAIWELVVTTSAAILAGGWVMRAEDAQHKPLGVKRLWGRKTSAVQVMTSMALLPVSQPGLSCLSIATRRNGGPAVAESLHRLTKWATQT